jgi:hypothetical protein
MTDTKRWRRFFAIWVGMGVVRPNVGRPAAPPVVTPVEITRC